MLVLTRQRGESIVIADNIQITIVEVHGDRVRLGIIAPAGIQVDRREIYEAKRAHAAAGINIPKPLKPRPISGPHPGIETAREPTPQPQGAPIPHVFPQSPPPPAR